MAGKYVPLYIYRVYNKRVHKGKERNVIWVRKVAGKSVPFCI